MKFSLIIGTLNRNEELIACLKSIEEQSFKDYEVIIIDQNSNNLCKDLIKEFSFSVKYFNVCFKGLSKARNYALENADGDFFCLMDDDAVYKKDFLEQIYYQITDNSKCIISGVIFSTDDLKKPFINCASISEGKILKTNEILNYCPSAALTIPIEVYKIIGGFNEQLGVGNVYASGEETDFLLRAMDVGYKVKHSKKVIAYHPIKPIDYANTGLIYKHAMGKGALFKLDFKNRKRKRLFWFALKNTLGMFIKACVSTEPYKSVYKTRLKGFVKGYKEF